jgi:bacteriocin-like protein
MKLHSAFVSAGLPAPTLRLEAVIGGGKNSLDCLHLMGDVIPALLPEILRSRIATEAELGVDTLIERMFNEVISNDSVIVGRSEIGAWCRMPSRQDLQEQADHELSEEELKQVSGGAIDAYIGSATGGGGPVKLDEGPKE